MLPLISISQTTTYSPEEEKMLTYVNNQYAYALKYGSTANLNPALDSCRKFIEKYPKSFAKPGVFSYMVEMAALNRSEYKIVSSLIDSAICYDPSSTTKFRIAELLIENEIDMEKGYSFLDEVFPNLTAPYYKYKSNILFARKSIVEGNRAAAKFYFEKALAEDSTRADGWIEYGTFLKYSEQPNEVELVLEKIRLLEEQDRLGYESRATGSPNLNKSILKYEVKDMDGKSFNFQKLIGKPLILQNFNFWCPMSKKHMKMLETIKKSFPNASILLMNVGESPEELRNRYLKKKENKFFKKHQILFGDSLMSHHIIGQTAKSILVIDKQGNIRADYSGYDPMLEEMLHRLLIDLSK